MAFCSNCGAQIKPEMRFCDNCGTPIRSAAPEQTIEQAVSAQPQGSYIPPAQQPQDSYTPPAQQPQGSYTPPAQQAQGSYTPPAQQAQGSYTPPAQQPPGSYTPPAQQPPGSYMPPAQQQSGAQAAYAPPQTAPKQKKPIDRKVFIFGGAALALILVVVLLVSLLGGKDKGGPVGTWKGVSLSAEGITMAMDEASMDGSIVFDIQKDGTCTVNAGPEKENGKWEKTKDGISIKAGAYKFDCKITGSTMVVENYAGSGMTLTLEKEGGKADAKPNDPNVGVWNVVSAEMWGFETDIKDIFANGFTIELLDKGKCKLNIDGTEGNGKWTLENGVITIKGGGLDTSGTLKDGVLVLEDVLGTGLKLKFQKEGAQASIGSTNSGFPADSDEPELSAGFQSPTTAIEAGSYWYGTAILSNFTPASRASEVEGTHDVWGYIGVASDGRDYFEVFETPEMDESPLLSMYINLYSDSFAADIGDEDAWILGIYLDESANVFFSPELDNGALSIDYHFGGENTSYDLTLFLREDGAPWDEENDPLPPGYDDYKAGLNGSAAQGGDNEAPSKPAELLSAAELRKAYDAMDPSGMTYEEVRDIYFDGVEGELYRDDDIRTYRWKAVEGDEKVLSMSFKKNAAGKYVYTSRSLNNIPS